MSLLYLFTAAVLSDVCSNTITSNSAALQNENCYTDTPCVNSDVSLDDNQRMEVKDRQGLDKGLYCKWNDPDTRLSGVCMQKLEDGERCYGDGECQSRRCAKLGSQEVHMRCIGVKSLQDFSTCYIGAGVTAPLSADRSCKDGSKCWPERSNALSGAERIFSCRRMEDIGEACDNLWTGSGSGAVIIAHTCNPNAPEEPRRDVPLVYCKVTNTTWRPDAVQASLHERMSSGVCTEVEDRDPGESCRVYKPSVERPNCGFGRYCKVSSATDAVCKELISEGDDCDEYDEANGGCESGTRCNLVTIGNGLRVGKCVELFSLDTPEEASDPELCKVDISDGSMAYWAPKPLDALVGNCRAMPYVASCTNDTDCQPEGTPLVPVYCDRDYNGQPTGTCKPLVPEPCHEQYEIWRQWTTNKYKVKLNLRGIHKRDKSIVKQLACCIADEMSGCNVKDKKLLVASGARLPSFMSNGAWFDLYGNHANYCESSGLDIVTLIILCVLGLCICSICLYIVISECIWDMNREKKEDKESSSSSSGDKMKGSVNPLPPYATPQYQREMQQFPAEPKTPANAQPGTAQPLTGYPPGSDVLVWYDIDQDGFHGWFDAIVLAYNTDDDTYTVQYTTAEVSEGVSSASVRLKMN